MQVYADQKGTEPNERKGNDLAEIRRGTVSDLTSGVKGGGKSEVGWRRKA